jgi:hypothetical protein
VKEKTHMKLYEYCESFGRMGVLTGRILLSDEDRASLEGATGIVDEALGKHSEVEIILNDKTLTVVTDDQAFLARATELGINLECGFDPRNYLNEVEIDEDA